MRYVAILVCAICLAFVVSTLVQADNISYWMPSTVVALAETNSSRLDVVENYASDDSRVTVVRGATDVLSWDALVAAYAQAKLLTPGGNALSATNRAVVVVPPGIYDGGTNTLTLDANYVDIVATIREDRTGIWKKGTDFGHTLIDPGDPYLMYDAPPTVLTGTAATNNQAFIVQSVEDVRLAGFGIEYYYNGDTSGNEIGFYVTAPNGGNASYYEDMHFFSDEWYDVYPTLHEYNFAGTWVRCTATDTAFRLRNKNTTPYSQKFSPVMVDCHAGTFSFGGDSNDGIISNAYMIGCSSPGMSFGGCTYHGLEIDSTSTFIECEALPWGHSFGLGHVVAGTFIRCRGGEASVGATYTLSGTFYQSTFTGYAEDCTFGGGSLGGSVMVGNTNNYNAGTVINCVVTGSTNTHYLKGATIINSYFENTGTNQHTFTLLDGTSKIINSVVEVDSAGTGLPVYAASAQNIVFVNNAFNNADNDSDGLGANVTKITGTEGWSGSSPDNAILADGSVPMASSLNMGANSATNMSSLVFTNSDSITVDALGMYLNTDYIFSAPQMVSANASALADFTGDYARFGNLALTSYIGVDGSTSQIKIQSDAAVDIDSTTGSVTIDSGAGGTYLNYNNSNPLWIKNARLVNNVNAASQSITNLSSLVFTNGWSIQCTTNGLEFVAP